MENPSTKQVEKYEGPSIAATAVVESKTYAVGGSIVGAIVGAVASELLFKPEGKGIAKATEWLKDVGIPVKGKWAMVAASALISSKIGHMIGGAIGAGIGVKQASRAPEQFERTQRRIVALEQAVEDLQKPTRFSETLTPATSHVEAVASETPAELGR